MLRVAFDLMKDIPGRPVAPLGDSAPGLTIDPKDPAFKKRGNRTGIPGLDTITFRR